MTDKEKIRKEVQRLMSELIQEKEKGYGSDTDDACILELQNVLTYIDSLQEEPVSRTPADIEAAMQEVEEKSKAFTEAYQGESFDEILAWMRGEEPVSEDLEEASRKYADNEEYGDDVYFAIKAAFKEGAQWLKEQMIKDAVYGLVCGHDESSPAWIDLNLLNKPNIKVGTEVKLIIIKDE